MKFFHLSDLHIGLKLNNKDLKEDQEYIFGQIILLAKKQRPDAVIIAGDIYDKAIPSAEAVELFDRFVLDLKEALPDAAIMMISGNHDSAARLNLYRRILNKRGIYMIGMPPQKQEERIEKVVLEDDCGPVNFYLLPFVRPSMVKAVVGTDENGNNLSYNETVKNLIEREEIDETQRNVLVSHQFYLPAGMDADKVERMKSELPTIGNIDLVNAQILQRFDYAALGHIHKPMQVGSEYARYCGTPLACSVSEAGQQKCVLLVEMKEKGDVTVTPLPLTPLRQVRVITGAMEKVLEQACEDYVAVILTDKVDLDVIDMQDRMRHAFPNLLEIRREAAQKEADEYYVAAEAIPDTYEMCLTFLHEPEDEAEKALLQDIIHTVTEVK